MSRAWSSRRTVAAWLLAGLVLLVWGFPPLAGAVRTAIRLAPAEAGERFPCEGCGCGCASAHECWTACCCHSLEQRVGWARANDIPIPHYVAVPTRLLERPEPNKANCALCVAGEGAAAPARVVLPPSASRARCKRIDNWWFVPPPTCLASGWLIGVVPATCVPALRPVDDRTPPGRSLRPPTPPPRLV